MNDLATLAPLALALIAAGAFGGLIAGLLGVGGGIVIVPALFHLFTSLGIDSAVKMHLAVGTSLSTIIATSTASMRAHRRRGAVDFALLRAWAPWIGLGVIIGTLLAAQLSGPALSGVFAGVALIVALYMAFAPEHWRLASAPPGGAARALLATPIGGLSVMMGIGGGTLTVPTLVLSGAPVHRAVGTASAVGFLIAIPGAIGFVIAGWNAEGLPPGSLGYVSGIGFALLLPATMLFAPVGAWLAHKLSKRLLRYAFAAFLALTALRMGYGLVTG